MNCQTIKENIIDYLEDNLSESLKSDIERHIEQCAECREAMEQYKQIQKRLEEDGDFFRGNQVEQQLMVRVQEIDPRKTKSGRVRFSQWFFSTAAVILLCIGGIAYWNNNLNIADSQCVSITGQNELFTGSYAAMNIQVRNWRKDNPVADAEVKLALVSENNGRKYELGKFRTNSAGCLDNAFYIPELDSGKYTFVVSARSSYGRDKVERKIKLQRPSQLYVTTDKPVYQPGQIIHIKSIARNSFSGKPLANEKAVIEVFDAKGTKVFKKQIETSTFGITSADFKLASLVGLGKYKVRVAVDEVESEKTVVVDRYVLPKFKAELITDKSWYLPGQIVKVDLQSDYFFGKPVSDAEVDITVTAMFDKPVEIHTSSGVTNKSGHYKCSFTLDNIFAGVPAAGGNALVELKAEVVDNAGQSITKNIVLPVSSNAINIIALPENGKLVPGMANRVYILAAYPDGKPAMCSLDVNGYKKQSDRTGLAIVEIDGPEMPKHYSRYDTPKLPKVSLKIIAKDADGKTGSYSETLNADNIENAMILRTDKAVYRGGDTVDVSVICADGSKRVFVDMIRGGQTILTKAVGVNDGMGRLAVDLPPHVFGTLKICAYKTGYWSQSRLIQVVRAESLDIQAKLDKNEYRPGQNAKVDFTVTDKNGEPVQSALGVSVVDEAVFHVSPQRPGLLAAYLEADQEMLEPAYQIKFAISRSDILNPDYANQELTKALFSASISKEQIDVEMLRRYVDPDTLDYIYELMETNPEMIQDYIKNSTNTDINIMDYIQAENIYSMRLSTHDDKQYEHGRNVRYLNGKLVVATIVLIGVCFVVMLFVLYGERAIYRILIYGSIISLLVSILMPAFNRASRSSSEIVGMAAMSGLEIGLKDAQLDGMLPELPRDSSATKPVRIREYFPETLFFNPEIITDESGQATLDLTMADSITNWKMAVDAIDARGALGGNEFDIRVFQPFFVEPDLPVSLTRNDIISIPIACYNYLDHAQKIELKVSGGDWFEFVGSDDATITLDAGEVRSIYITIKALKVGKHKLAITANGEQFSDAVSREIEVVSDGAVQEYLVNGTLSGRAIHTMAIPHDAIDNSQVLGLSIYPSRFSEVVEGLDNIFRMPHGCFEQTSSIAYPNVMALMYMQNTGQVSPEVEARASEFINAGYQRLLTFEVKGGGFDWYGNPPASEVLTAFGIMEFCDMAKVHNVDPVVIERACNWLRDQQKPQGYWSTRREFYTAGQANSSDAATTAFVAWALSSAGRCEASVVKALSWLNSNQEVFDNNYILALVANASLLIDDDNAHAKSLVQTLANRFEQDGQAAWLTGTGQSAVYSRGTSLDIETTALGTLALIESGRYPELATKAQKWLSLQKDQFGTFSTTQATVLSLKALVAGFGKSLGEANDCNISVLVNGRTADKVSVNGSNYDVVQLVDLSGSLGYGNNTIELIADNAVELNYRLAGKYYVPGVGVATEEKVKELDIEVEYDRTQVQVDAGILCNVTVTNQTAAYINMAIVDLGIPPGFEPDTSGFETLINRGIISRYEVTGRQVILYLRGLESGQLKLSYKLKALYPVKVKTPPSSIWEYYNPENQAESVPVNLEITTSRI